MGYKGKSFSETRCARCLHAFGHIYHICRDASEVAHRIVHQARPGAEKGRRLAPRSEEYRAKISEGQRNRWLRKREKDRERDEALVKRYLEGDVGVKKLAETYGMAYQTARRIIMEAGVMRPKGQWISRNGVVNSHNIVP